MDIIARRIACAIVLLATLTSIGCSRESERSNVVQAPRVVVHRTIDLDDAALDSSALRVRDLVTGEQFWLGRVRNLLVLAAPDGVLDTLRVFVDDSSASTALSIGTDSSFAVLQSDMMHTDVICIADARLHWAARIPNTASLPASEDTLLNMSHYVVTHRLTRAPRSLSGIERYIRSDHTGESESWQLPFELRFDDSLRVFYNTSLMLDDVPVASSSSVVSGQYPGIALRIGTSVYVDGEWYALSVPADLDPLELAHGTVGLVLEGKGEWGDTLHALRVPQY